MKFEQYVTKKISNLIYHGIDLVRTQFRKPENHFRREKQPAFSRIQKLSHKLECERECCCVLGISLIEWEEKSIWASHHIGRF